MNQTYNLERIENEYTDTLESRGFEVYRGWNETLAEKIVNLSQQPHILETTPGDAERRFQSVNDAQIWHNMGHRSIYTLHGDDVAGLIWYDIRIRRDPNADYTFAIRTYEEAHGKKLAYGFMKAAHQDFADRKGNPAVWLDVALDNSAARHLYRKFGYRALSIENGRELMMYNPNNRLTRKDLGAF